MSAVPGRNARHSVGAAVMNECFDEKVGLEEATENFGEQFHFALYLGDLQ